LNRRRAAAIVLLGFVLICTVSYALTVVWTRNVNGPASDIDAAHALALAPNEDLYVVGSRTDPGEARNIWIRKYDSNGNTKWTRVVDGSGSSSDDARGVAVDVTGNLYVVGYISPSTGSPRIWIRKYTSSGVKIWTRTVEGLAGSAIAHGAAVDSDSNLYVVGYTYTSTGQEDIWIRKYNSSGAKQWTRTVGGVGAVQETARGAAVDSAGNLYVVGEIYGGSAEVKNIWIRKYSSAGAKLWTRTVNGSGDGWDSAYGVAVDSTNDLYVVGHVTVAGEGLNIWIRKYSSSGAKLWTRVVNGPDDSTDRAHGVTFDSNDAVYLTGFLGLADNSHIFWVRKYSSSGVKRWTQTKVGPNGDLEGHGIAVNSTNRVYVGGEIEKLGEESNIWVRKYRQ